MNDEQKTLVKLLGDVAATNPDAVAVEFGDQTLTYAELHRASLAMAAMLIATHDVKPGELVGISLDPSIERVVAVLAIVQAGAAFVPIDPDLPRLARATLVESAALRLLVTQSKYAIDFDLSSTGIALQSVLVDRASTDPAARVPPLAALQPDAPVYVIFTSGSTGAPKGVVIAQRGLLNLIESQRELLRLGPGRRFLQFASIGFDAAVYEIFGALGSGATLVLGARRDLLPGRPLADFLHGKEITHVLLPPSILSAMNDRADTLPHLGTLIAGGEACSLQLAKTWAVGGRRFLNAYGPTEATVVASVAEYVAGDSSLSIGAPLPNVTAHILDDRLEPVAIGTPGELYLGGIGVALGYHRQPELTARLFVANPFGSGTLYKTGDQASIDPTSGMLRFVGRLDQQIKIRGFRVELGAIEAAASDFRDVGAVVVLDTEEPIGTTGRSSRFLVAYVQPKPGDALDVQALKRFLLDRLPDYMVPHHYVVLDELPMTANRSKVDRSKLPAAKSLIAAEGPVRKEVAQIAKAFDHALDLPLGTTTSTMDFFQLGGDSLCMASVLHELSEGFETNLPTRLIYENPTPAALWLAIDAHRVRERAGLGAESTVDLGVEALPTDADRRAWARATTVGEAPARRILLTGATGFLGSHLLASLVRRQQFERIHVLVRATDAAAARQRLCATFEANRIDPALLTAVTPIAADLVPSELGLRHDDYRVLADSVDAVYHAAADISYVRPYSAVKKPNVEGTRNVLRFASCGAKKHVHHVSSLGIYGAAWTLLGCSQVDEQLDIDRVAPILDIENGYVKAKWVAERLVRHAREAGLAVSVYRPGFIQGRADIGLCNIGDLFCRLLIGCVQLGMYPHFPEKYWLPVPVDYVADAIAHIGTSCAAGGSYNLTVDREGELGHDAIFEHLGALGYPMERTSPNNWLAALKLQRDNALGPLLGFLAERVLEGRHTILEVHHRTPRVDTTHADSALRGSGIEKPIADAALMTTYMSYFARLGLVARPGR